MVRFTGLFMGWVVIDDSMDDEEGVVWSRLSSGPGALLQQGKLSPIVFHCNIMNIL